MAYKCQCHHHCWVTCLETETSLSYTFLTGHQFLAVEIWEFAKDGWLASNV